MNNKDKKIIEEQDKLLDHLIEYGGRQYIDEEIKKYEELPELEPSKEFDERMNRMFEDAYKQEERRERIRFGKKIAVIAVAAVGVISAAAMNIKAVRQPVLNLIFKQGNPHTKTNTSVTKQDLEKYSFSYLPNNYSRTKKQYMADNYQIIYKFENTNNNAPIYIKIQINQKYDNYINQSILKKYEELVYKNQKYYFLAVKQKNSLLFYKNQSIFSITSSINKDELLKIAQNIKIKN